MPLYVYAQRIPLLIVHSPNLPVKICHVCIRGSGACEAILLFVSRLISFQTVSANRAISQVSQYTWPIPILHVTSVRRITYGFREFMWFCNIHLPIPLKVTYATMERLCHRLSPWRISIMNHIGPYRNVNTVTAKQSTAIAVTIERKFFLRQEVITWQAIIFGALSCKGHTSDIKHNIFN